MPAIRSHSVTRWARRWPTSRWAAVIRGGDGARGRGVVLGGDLGVGGGWGGPAGVGAAGGAPPPVAARPARPTVPAPPAVPFTPKTATRAPIFDPPPTSVRGWI